MKKAILKLSVLRNQTLLLITLIFLSLIGVAQEKGIDVNINTKPEGSNFMSQPWVWVVGGAVFLLLLVALLRNKK